MATKAENKVRLEREALDFLRRRYPFAAELSLMPKSGSQVPNFNAFESWVGDVMAELAGAQQAVDDAVLPDTGDLVALDLAGLVASDPNLVLRDFVRL